MGGSPKVWTMGWQSENGFPRGWLGSMGFTTSSDNGSWPQEVFGSHLMGEMGGPSCEGWQEGMEVQALSLPTFLRPGQSQGSGDWLLSLQYQTSGYPSLHR